MIVDFIDTNVFIYLFDETAPEKQETAQSLIQKALNDGSACISHQVVQESLNVITGKLKVPVSFNDARDFLQECLVPLWRIMPSERLYLKGLELQERYRYGFYDSQILAAALEAGCARLLSEDFQDGQKIEGLRIENPFS